MAKEDWPDWEIYTRDRCTCVYCGFSGLNSFPEWRQLTIDHIIPQGQGGSDTPENKVVSCARCNSLLGRAKPEGGNPKEMIAWKRAYVADKNAQEYGDFQTMMIELLPKVFEANWPAT